MTLLLHQYLRTYPKYCNGHKNRKCYLILMLQNKPKNLFYRAKINPSYHSEMYLHNISVKRKNTPKHLGLFLTIYKWFIIRGTSKKQLYLELDLESLRDRRRQTKNVIHKTTHLLYELILSILNSHGNPRCYRALYCRIGFLAIMFYLPVLTNGIS